MIRIPDSVEPFAHHVPMDELDPAHPRVFVATLLGPVSRGCEGHSRTRLPVGVFLSIDGAVEAIEEESGFPRMRHWAELLVVEETPTGMLTAQRREWWWAFDVDKRTWTPCGRPADMDGACLAGVFGIAGNLD